MPNTTMLLKMLITPVKTEKGKLYKKYTLASNTHAEENAAYCNMQVPKNIYFQSSAILQRG